ncbi:MAG: DUF3307 domain-containing protein [Leeuwenhoekiella sp.]
MIILAIKLLTAHVLGDFILQPDHWVAGKKAYKYKSKYLYFHGLVHLLALIVLLGFDFSYWPYILLIVFSHLIIDLMKLQFENQKNSRKLFVADQCLHLAVIALVIYLIDPYTFDLSIIYSAPFLLTILAVLLVSFVSATFMKVILGRWDLDEENNASGSLQNAGKYIGILERLFVFGLIVLNQWSAIGLLITAKSVFRFSDLTRAKDRKLTEYILIGTLMSFGLAILIGIVYKYILNFLE